MSTLRVNTIQNTSSVTILPTGNVIQTGYARYDPNADSYTTVALNTELDSDVSLTFTPKFSTSKLLVRTQYHTRIINANGISFGIRRDGTKIPGQFQRDSWDFFYKGDQVNHHYTGKCECYIDANNTNPTTFTIHAQGWDGGTWERSYAFGDHSILVMEIAQ